MPSRANSLGEMWRSFSISVIFSPFRRRSFRPRAVLSCSSLGSVVSGAILRRVLLDALTHRLVQVLDLDRAHGRLDDAAHEIDVQQPVIEPGAGDLDTVRQHE